MVVSPHRFFSRVIASFLFLAPAAYASGQQPPATDAKAGESGSRTLTIVVPSEGEHYVRFIPSPETKKPTDLPHRFTDTKTTVPVPPGLGKSPKIAVDDVKTGNTAVVPVPKDGTLELRRIDFDHVHSVKVVVSYDNKPVQVAQVTLTPKDKQVRRQTIDAASVGTAVFTDVPTGDAILQILYGDRKVETKTIDISSDHPQGVVMISAAVSNKVPTVDAPLPTAPGAPSAPNAGGAAPVSPAPGIQPVAAPPDTGGGIAGLIGTLIGLGIAGGAIYLLYRWAQSGGMAATLKNAGIEVSAPTPGSDSGTPWNPNAPPPPVVSDPSICQFCGQKKDASGNCACTLSGSAINTGPASPAIPTQPRLVATMGVYSGTVFPLNANGSALTVGREPTTGISLSNDTTVSRLHASIRTEGGQYVIADEGSSNGVFVNGVRIAGSQPINPGDEVQIGNTRFRFEV